MMPGGVDLIAVFRDLCKPLFSHGSFMRLLVLAGDGIGPEITAATLLVLQAAARRFRLDLDIEEDVVGHESLKRYGTTVRADLLDKARAADGLILGPASTFDFKD